ncbi:glycosyltransferase family 2 protein [Microbacterium sp. Leaf288]|uniref:glycosyltransferase family 2 protein n=1 Tax=Microbacterium sp. Leaf288 TaxID=1736323 RepID=UPI00138F7006|nr:glycosyltransferase [Microbacterium sp. Leaf288]
MIVHHRNFPDVLNTVQQVLSQGVAPENVILVDNSEDHEVRAALEQFTPQGVAVSFVGNDGYGAAANFGIEWVVTNRPNSEYVLVSSHEAVALPHAVSNMTQYLDLNPDCGVVGPVLLIRGSRAIWSSGGQLTKFGRRPVHRMQELDRPTSCSWVDGAFAIYRLSALTTDRFDAQFFMYYEETDLHMRLGKKGWKVAVIPEAVVEQDTNGAPPYYVGRNSYLFLRRHAGLLPAWLTSVREATRFCLASGSVRERRVRLRDYVTGLRDAIAARPT